MSTTRTLTIRAVLPDDWSDGHPPQQVVMTGASVWVGRHPRPSGPVQVPDYSTASAPTSAVATVEE